MTQFSNIDDVLATAHLPPEQRPAPQLNVVKTETLDVPEDLADVYQPESKPDHEPKEQHTEKLPTKTESVEEKPKQESKPNQEKVDDDNFDEYGNEKPPRSNKTYSEDEVNERINQAIRERMARMEKNNPNVRHQQPNQQQNPQQPAQTPEEWQEQLKELARQAIREDQEKAQQLALQQREQQLTQEFEDKFKQGMQKFPDFHDVVRGQPFSDAMTMACRAMKDPAAFIYAASKRQPGEIQRISQINDPYTQMVEIGKLDERMRKTQQGTKAPKPVKFTREDTTVEEPAPKPKTGDDILAQEDAARMQKRRNTVGSRWR